MGNTGGNSDVPFQLSHSCKTWIFQQQSEVRNLQLLTQFCHVHPSHEHCDLNLIHPYLSGQKLQLHQSNPQPTVSLPNSFATEVHVMGHS